MRQVFRLRYIRGSNFGVFLWDTLLNKSSSALCCQLEFVFLSLPSGSLYCSIQSADHCGFGRAHVHVDYLGITFGGSQQLQGRTSPPSNVLGGFLQHITAIINKLEKKISDYFCIRYNSTCVNASQALLW